MKFSIILCLGLLVTAIGCSASEKPDDSPNAANETPRAEVRLRVAVIDDPALAAAIRRRAGEWNAQTGGTLDVTDAAKDFAADRKQLDADVLIYPSHMLGELAERKLIAPLRAGILRQNGYDANDVFPLLRRRDASWGGTQVAVPLGSPVYVVYYRADLLEALRRTPPASWEEYADLAALLADREKLAATAPNAVLADGESWRGVLEPIAEGWAWRTFLSRAACYARHRGNYSTLFNIDTMEPLIDGPPFVRALEEMVECGMRIAECGMEEAIADRETKNDVNAGGETPHAAHEKSTSSDDSPIPHSLSPAAVRRAIHAGECGMALAWPSAADSDDSPARLPIGIADLPGSRRVYDARGRRWEDRTAADDGRVPLVGMTGRLASVATESKNAASAFRLLAWLGGPEVGAAICSASPATTLFRSSQTASPGAWVEPSLAPAAARDYARQTEGTLSRETGLSALQLPGAEEYAAALDAETRAALSGRKSPQEALSDAAQAWRAVTARLGSEKQRTAYRRSLGMEE